MIEHPIRVGITMYAQAQLGELTFVELPETGERLGASDAFGLVESLKSVNDLYMPVSAEVLAVNSLLVDDATIVNQDPLWGRLAGGSATGRPVGHQGAAHRRGL